MPDSPKPVAAYPGHEKFVFDTPLYSIQEIPNEKEKVLIGNTAFTIDGYCPSCKTSRVFISVPLDDPTIRRATILDNGAIRKNAIYEGFLRFYCAKQSAHQICIYVQMALGKIQKLGQKPSYADIVTAQDAGLTKALSALDRREYNKAVGLAAHDVGIGAYAYLRRIFERLIWERFNLHKEENRWDDGTFTKLRMNEKISTLKEYLPPILVANAATYSILSDGIHNLSEEQCLAFFPILRKGILLILHQENERRELERDQEEFTRAIAKYSAT